MLFQEFCLLGVVELKSLAGFFFSTVVAAVVGCGVIAGAATGVNVTELLGERLERSAKSGFWKKCALTSSLRLRRKQFYTFSSRQRTKPVVLQKLISSSIQATILFLDGAGTFYVPFDALKFPNLVSTFGA